MTSRFIRAAALAAMFLIPTVAPHAESHASIDNLCRAYGVDREENVTRIRESYLGAVEAGISDDELYPFVEEILGHKLTCEQMVRVLAATAALKRDGLPYFVVLSKVREGVAKAAPPVLIVEAAESKLRTLSESRDVLKSLESLGYRVLDFQNAAVVVSSFLDRGYSPEEVVSRIRKRGIEGAGFAALSGVVEKPLKKKER